MHFGPDISYIIGSPCQVSAKMDYECAFRIAASQPNSKDSGFNVLLRDHGFNYILLNLLDPAFERNVEECLEAFCCYGSGIVFQEQGAGVWILNCKNSARVLSTLRTSLLAELNKIEGVRAAYTEG